MQRRPPGITGRPPFRYGGSSRSNGRARLRARPEAVAAGDEARTDRLASRVAALERGDLGVVDALILLGRAVREERTAVLDRGITIGTALRRARLEIGLHRLTAD